MSIGQEVEADLPGPFAELGVLPSYDAIQLVRPGATIWDLIKNLTREKRTIRAKIQGETILNDLKITTMIIIIREI